MKSHSIDKSKHSLKTIPPLNIAFGGGGVKGIAWGGILWIFDELRKNNTDFFRNVKRVSGTSAGAIAATLYALGYSGDECLKIMMDMNFPKFKDAGNFGFLSKIYNLYRYDGIYKGDYFLNWMKTVIQIKTGFIDITFAQLHEIAKDRGFKDLYITSTKVTQQDNKMISELVLFSHETTPNHSVAEAVRKSMSLPGFYATLKDIVDGQVTAFYLDGGMTTNVPEEVFNYGKYTSDCEYLDEYLINNETLAFELCDPSELSNDEKNFQNINLGFFGKILKLTKIIFEIAINAPQNYSSSQARSQIIKVSNEGVGTADFNLGLNEKFSLVISGVNAVRSAIIKSLDLDNLIANKLVETLKNYDKDFSCDSLTSFNSNFKQTYISNSLTNSDDMTNPFNTPRALKSPITHRKSFVDNLQLVQTEDENYVSSLYPEKEKNTLELFRKKFPLNQSLDRQITDRIPSSLQI